MMRVIIFFLIRTSTTFEIKHAFRSSQFTAPEFIFYYESCYETCSDWTCKLLSFCSSINHLDHLNVQTLKKSDFNIKLIRLIFSPTMYFAQKWVSVHVTSQVTIRL